MASLSGTAVSALRDMVSNSATFQAWVGAANAAGALPRVYAERVVTPTRPFALTARDGINWTVTAGGTRKYLYDSGSIFLLFEDDYDETTYSDNWASAIEAFDNSVENTMQEVLALSGLDDYLVITGAQTIMVTNISDVREGIENKILQCAYNIEWDTAG